MNNKLVTYALVFLTSFLISLVVIFLSYFTYISTQIDRTAPWISLNGKTSYANLSTLNVTDKLKKLEDSYVLKISINDQDEFIKSSDIDLTINIEETLDQLHIPNEDESFIYNIYNTIYSFIYTDFHIKVSYDQDKLNAKLKYINTKHLTNVQDASLEINLTDNVYSYNEAKIGIFYEEALAEEIIKDGINGLNPSVNIIVNKTFPEIKGIYTSKLVDEMKTLWSQNLSLKVGNKSLHLSSQELKMLSRLSVNGSNSGIVNIFDDNIIDYKWDVSSEEISKTIEQLSASLTQEVQEPTIINKDKQNFILVHSQTGISIDKEATRQNIVAYIRSGGKGNFDISHTTQRSLEDTESMLREKNVYDVSQQIGEGVSTFPNTDWARTTNIKAAMGRLNNYVIAPNSEFSLYEGLDGINPQDGYVVGHALSGGRVISSFAGGVCQVATTVFRAGLETGLDITERHNHSMWLSLYTYPYEKNVVDAAIYFSANDNQDLKFKNDSKFHIIVQTSIDLNTSDNLYYASVKLYSSPEFAKREVTLSNFKTWNLRYNTNIAEIEDPSLPVGTRKLIQDSVPGISGSFSRVVKQGGEILYEDEFISNYYPYSAAYKVGTKVE